MEVLTRDLEISIVVPVYGSEVILPELVRQVAAVMDQQQWTYEVIFVCDQSPDNSWRVICELQRQNASVRGILLRINAGQHNALMAGLNEARGRIIVTMDDDLQHSPADIPSLVEGIKVGYDVVYARFTNRRHPLWKIMGSRINDMVARFLVKKPRDLYLSPFRAMQAGVRDEIQRYTGPFVYVDGLILCATRNIHSVDVEHHARSAGNSRYGFRKSFSLWLKMATSFSIAPLRLTSVVGVAVALLGFLFALYLVIERLTMDVMPTGWASLIVTILIMGGAQLIALGLLGEYLGRMFLTINARPQYVIAQRVGFRPDNDGHAADQSSVQEYNGATRLG
jgi:undecaprenyl-phosphate 4-deoxy-4-formamido-L-arabinose transferase